MPNSIRCMRELATAGLLSQIEGGEQSDFWRKR